VTALRNGSPLDPPLDVLRRVLDGFPPPAGYPPIDNPSALVSLRDQLLAQVAPRQAVALTLELFFDVSPAGHAVLIGRPAGVSTPRYRLVDTGSYGFDVAGIPLESLPPPTLPGAGLLIPGTIATVIGVPVATTDVAVETITIAVEAIELVSVPMTSDLDLDGNGLPDSWQYAFLGALGTPFGQDSDGDGFLDPEEYSTGSDPNDAASVPAGLPASPRNLGLGVDDSGNVSILWDGSPVAVYQLWVATDLGDWAPYGVAPMSDGVQTWVVQLSGEEPWRFFRVHVTIPLP
jgi:hypothetical protein